jgi:hypothetical protein
LPANVDVIPASYTNVNVPTFLARLAQADHACPNLSPGADAILAAILKPAEAEKNSSFGLCDNSAVSHKVGTLLTKADRTGLTKLQWEAGVATQLKQSAMRKLENELDTGKLKVGSNEGQSYILLFRFTKNAKLFKKHRACPELGKRFSAFELEMRSVGTDASVVRTILESCGLLSFELPLIEFASIQNMAKVLTPNVSAWFRARRGSVLARGVVGSRK